MIFSSPTSNIVQPIFTAKLTMRKNVITKPFTIYDKQDKKQAIVRPKPIHKKENIFREFVIESNDEVFDVKSSFVFKGFTITNKKKEKVVAAKRVSSFMKNIIEIRDYKIDIINDSYVNTFLWIAITKGIIDLFIDRSPNKLKIKKEKTFTNHMCICKGRLHN